MEQYETDEQRGEAFKAWLAKNVPIILLGVAIGLGGVYGFNHYRAKAIETASVNGDLFYRILVAAEQSDVGKVKELVSTLDKTKDTSGYWALSQLELAGAELKSGSTDNALQILDGITISTADSSLKALAQYRSARIYFDKKQMDKSRLVLNALVDSGFQGLRKELEGDIYLTEAKTMEAIEAFKAANVAGGATDLLPIKLESLGIKLNNSEN